MCKPLATVVLILSISIPVLNAEDATPAETEAGTAATIDLSKNGTYTSGVWTYTVKITGEGTKSQGLEGALTFRDQPVHPAAKVNDWVETPWGKMYCMGEVILPWERHGWMPQPRRNAPDGRQLDAPKE